MTYTNKRATPTICIITGLQPAPSNPLFPTAIYEANNTSPRLSTTPGRNKCPRRKQMLTHPCMYDSYKLPPYNVSTPPPERRQAVTNHPPTASQAPSKPTTIPTHSVKLNPPTCFFDKTIHSTPSCQTSGASPNCQRGSSAHNGKATKECSDVVQ